MRCIEFDIRIQSEAAALEEGVSLLQAPPPSTAELPPLIHSAVTLTCLPVDSDSTKEAPLRTATRS